MCTLGPVSSGDYVESERPVKVSARKLRTPCPDCGTNEVYWAELNGKRVLINRTLFSINVPVGTPVPVSQLHDCKGN